MIESEPSSERGEATFRVETPDGACGERGVFCHLSPRSLPTSRDLLLGAVMPVRKGHHVFLRYRLQEGAFESMEMRRRGWEKYGLLPREALHGPILEYFIEVIGPDGQVVERSGSPASPHRVPFDQTHPESRTPAATP